MYLTRFRVNVQRSAARRMLASPEMLHAAVMTSFPTPPRHGDHGPRVLWRLDRRGSADTHLYIVSPDRPDLTHLVEQAGWPTVPGGWQTGPYQPFLSRLRVGDRWAFRLTANPVHSIRRNRQEPTKITAHVGPRHQAGWLLAREMAAGFRVVRKPPETRRLPDGDEQELVVHNRRQLAFKKSRATKPVTLLTVTYDGLLEITDVEAFRRTLICGLGRAKAYGCGLMTLASVRP